MRNIFLIILVLLSLNTKAQKVKLVVPAAHSGYINAAVYVNNDEILITTSSDETIKVWRARDGVLLNTINAKESYSYIEVTTNKNIVFLSNENGFALLDIQRYEIIKRKSIQDMKGSFLMSNKNDFYYVTGLSQTYEAKYNLYKYDIASNSERFLISFIDTAQKKRFINSIKLSGSSKTKKLLLTGFVGRADIFEINNYDINSIYYNATEKSGSDIAYLAYRMTELGQICEDKSFKISTKRELSYLDPSTRKVVKKINLDTGRLPTGEVMYYNEEEGTNTIIPIQKNCEVVHVNERKNYVLIGNRTISSYSYQMIDKKTGNQLYDLGKLLFVPGKINTSKDFKKYWLTSNAGALRYLDVTDGRIQMIFTNERSVNRQNSKPKFQKNTFYQMVGENIGVFQYDKNQVQTTKIDLKAVFAKEFPQNDWSLSSISDDGKLAAFTCSTKILIYNISLKKIANTIEGDFSHLAGLFSPDNQFYYYSGGAIPEGQDQTWDLITCYKTTGSRKPVWQAYLKAVAMEYLSAKEILIYEKMNENGMVYLNPATGATLRTVPSEIKVAFDTRAKLYTSKRGTLFTKESNLYSLSDTQKLKLISDKLVDNKFSEYDYFFTDRFVIYATASGTYAIHDIQKGRVVAELYLFEDSNDWLIKTPDGRFDGSPKATKSIYYSKGNDIIEVDAIFEKFYTPNLLARLLNGESFPVIDDINNLRPKPKAKILYSEKQRNLEVGDDKPSYTNTTGIAEITVNATAPEDKIDEIRLFHNGKVITLATRGMFVTENDGTDSKKYTVNLLPGANNFRAVSLNSQRTESDADEITVSYAASGNQPSPKPTNTTPGIVPIDMVDKTATMYLMVVGINAYKDKIRPLAYALPDATAFKEEVEKDAKSMLANIKTYFISDAKADKAGIINAFTDIKQNAKPQDVFVFYYAGHGYIHPGTKEFYLLSADVADGGESLLKNGVPAKELQQYAVEIQAQKQLFVLDACQSAGAFEKMLQHDGEQQKSLALVARSTGTHWMAASGSTETAKEFAQLGHGAFTYVLLQALKGEAAANKMITVNGLKNFLLVQVPELVKKYGGNSQYPASYGAGNDFPVEVFK